MRQRPDLNPSWWGGSIGPVSLRRQSAAVMSLMPPPVRNGKQILARWQNLGEETGICRASRRLVQHIQHLDHDFATFMAAC
jgi:hypothetical protein